MSASRIARAGRSRFFIGLGIIILTMGFVAIFQSSQQQLNELRHMELRCEQEQKLLGSQLEDASRSLKAERTSHQQTRDEMVSKANEQKEHSEKSVHETNLKLSSLQQHFKLLKSEHEDSKEACAKAKAKQLEEINGMQRKIKALETQNGQAVKEKDKAIELLKAKYNQLLSTNAILEKVVKEKKYAMPDLPSEIERLTRQIAQFKEHTAWRPSANDDVVSSAAANQMEHPQDVQTQRTSNNKHDISFSAQIPLMQKPLADPLPIAASQSSTTAKISNAKTSEASVNGKFEIPNAPIPDQLKLSSTTSANRRAEENFGKQRLKQVPNGVVPIQTNLEEMINRDVDASYPNESAAQNNRYVNVADAMVANAERKKAAVAAVQNNDAKDNVAHEVNDNNDFIVYERSHKEHMPAALGDNKFNVINNAAEEDMNLYDNNKFNLAKANAEHGNDGDLNFAGHKRNDGGKLLAHNANNDNGKFLNEIDADGGRVGYADGDEAHLEEQMEEDDDDEYANPAAHKEPAVRN